MFIFDYGKSKKLYTYPAVMHGTDEKLPFILSGSGDYLCDSEYFTERDELNESLLIYTLAGKGKAIFRKTELELTPNTAVIINCREYQKYMTDNSVGEWHFLWIHFSGEFEPVYEKLINENNFKLVTDNSTCDLLGKMRKLMTYNTNNTETPDVYIHTTSFLLHEIIIQLYRLSKENKTEIEQLSSETVKKATEFITHNFASKICIDEIAAQCNLSKYHFIRIFKKIYGKTPYEFLILYRVNYSKGLLISTEDTINEISLKCGYSDSKSYISSFKNIVGVTPVQYRKSNRI